MSHPGIVIEAMTMWSWSLSQGVLSTKMLSTALKGPLSVSKTCNMRIVLQKSGSASRIVIRVKVMYVLRADQGGCIRE